MKQQLLLFLWAAVAVVSLATLVFVVVRPAGWASIVDRENNFWVRRGWISSQLAEKFKALEKGFTMRVVLGALFLMSLAVVCVLLRVPSEPHFKVMLPPPAPVQRHQPAH
jgi:hypothetical protein